LTVQEVDLPYKYDRSSWPNEEREERTAFLCIHEYGEWLVSITPGNPGPPDNYGFSGEGSINHNNQTGGDNGSPWLRGNDNPYAYNGERPGWRDAGPMQFTSSDGRTVYNIENAYFPISPGQIAANWGGYNPANNPQFDQVDPAYRQLVSMNAQNIWNAQQERQCMASERWSQGMPPQNYYSQGYRQSWIPPYGHQHHRGFGGPEFAVAANPFYSGYNPGQQGPGLNISLGRHGFLQFRV
jgi:hypothetical protein